MIPVVRSGVEVESETAFAGRTLTERRRDRYGQPLLLARRAGLCEALMWTRRRTRHRGECQFEMSAPLSAGCRRHGSPCTLRRGRVMPTRAPCSRASDGAHEPEPANRPLRLPRSTCQRYGAQNYIMVWAKLLSRGWAQSRAGARTVERPLGSRLPRPHVLGAIRARAHRVAPRQRGSGRPTEKRPAVTDAISTAHAESCRQESHDVRGPSEPEARRGDDVVPAQRVREEKPGSAAASKRRVVGGEGATACSRTARAVGLPIRARPPVRWRRPRTAERRTAGRRESRRTTPRARQAAHP